MVSLLKPAATIIATRDSLAVSVDEGPSPLIRACNSRVSIPMDVYHCLASPILREASSSASLFSRLLPGARPGTVRELPDRRDPPGNAQGAPGHLLQRSSLAPARAHTRHRSSAVRSVTPLDPHGLDFRRNPWHKPTRLPNCGPERSGLGRSCRDARSRGLWSRRATGAPQRATRIGQDVVRSQWTDNLPPLSPSRSTIRPTPTSSQGTRAKRKQRSARKQPARTVLKIDWPKECTSTDPLPLGLTAHLRGAS